MVVGEGYACEFLGKQRKGPSPVCDLDSSVKLLRGRGLGKGTGSQGRVTVWGLV